MQARTITLICSSHEEIGRCNPGELVKILQRLQPDVVFEERHPSIPLSTYDSVECRALNMYRELNLFERIPIDQYVKPENLFSEWHRAISHVEMTRQDYRELLEIEDTNLYRGGFAYINSTLFGKLSAKLRDIQDETISNTGDPALIRGLSQWRKFCHDREIQMVAKIYDYSRENLYERGLFIFGANHRAGILREIEKRADIEVGLIKWVITEG